MRLKERHFKWRPQQSLPVNLFRLICNPFFTLAILAILRSGRWFSSYAVPALLFVWSRLKCMGKIYFLLYKWALYLLIESCEGGHCFVILNKLARSDRSDNLLCSFQVFCIGCMGPFFFRIWDGYWVFKVLEVKRIGEGGYLILLGLATADETWMRSSSGRHESASPALMNDCETLLIVHWKS